MLTLLSRRRAAYDSYEIRNYEGMELMPSPAGQLKNKSLILIRLIYSPGASFCVSFLFSASLYHLEKQTVSCKSERYCILSRVVDQNATSSGFINFFFSFFLFFNKTRNIFPVLQYLTQAPSGKNAW